MNTVTVRTDSTVEFKARTLLNTDVEVNYDRYGGILHTVFVEFSARRINMQSG